MARLFLMLLIAGPVAAADYVRDIKPILQERCFACHGALKQNGKLRLDSAANILKGGSSGPAVRAKKSADSLLLQRVADPDEESRMPPEGQPLTADQLRKLKAWIDEGASFPADDAPEPDPRDHWAFRPPVRPTPPAGGSTNPVDAFLAARWKAAGVAPAPPAEKRLLLRRVYLDLIGLPPSREEIEAFLADPSPTAYEAVVNRLLASPQYGERWGRHLMDLWRYSDWWGLGAEVRNSQKHIWHWRDWIIESLNANVGYDRMIRLMLAADEIAPDDPSALRASGYLARPYFIFNRTTWLDETVEHAAKGFLGLTMNCAKCHDHKYDPIAQTDYYRFRAFFEPYQVRTDMVPGEPDYERDGIPRAFDCNADAVTYKHERGDDRRPVKGITITPGVPAVLGGEVRIRPVKLPTTAFAPHLRPFVEANYRQAADARIAKAKEGHNKARPDPLSTRMAPNQAQAAIGLADKTLKAATAELAALGARFVAERAKYAEPKPTNLADLAKEAARAERQAARAAAEESLAKAELDIFRAVTGERAALEKKRDAAKAALAAAVKASEDPGDTYTVPRGSLKTKESNVETDASRFKPFPTTSTGRRSGLANWIADRQNPLTARVMVNHVWARHFGRPLVATVFDFGRKGAKPSHPELLDWLAVEFMESGWSFKHLHRRLVTSSAYRLAGSGGTADAENKLFSRREASRMEAQTVRDSLLRLAGRLDPTMGGPSIPVTAESERRSLYFVHSHNDHQKFLMQFDDAAVLECYRRTESIVPQQALTLANSKFALAMAEAIAAKIGDQPDADFVAAAFELLLASTPTPAERDACLEAMKEWRDDLTGRKHPRPGEKARVTLVGALLNHNDFVTVR
jgi:hypothetical protein